MQAFQVTATVQSVVLSLDTSPKSFSPLVNRLVDNGLFKVSPDRHHALLQLDQVAYWFLVHALLQAAPNLVIDRVEVWNVRRPQLSPVK